MAKIESLTAQLDSLLKDIRNEKGSTINRNNASDDEWENVEDEVGDYFSVMNTEIKSKKNLLNEPLFPSDILKSGSTFDLQGKEKKKKRSGPANERNGDNLVAANNRKNTTKTGFFNKDFISNSDLAIKTIAELSKKVRELNAQLAVSQNKLRIAESSLSSLHESQAKEAMKEKEPVEVTDDKLSALEKQIKELNDKLSSSNTKLCEARNQMQQQKHEIKLMQKAIASEIGENVSLQTVTAEGWRGRAQHILSLQQKVNDLTEKLSQTNIPFSEKSSCTLLMLEKAQDKEKIFSLSNELDETKTALSEIKNKNDQARARIKVLVNEMNSLKAKYEALSMKNEEDVKLINTLTTRLTTISQKCHDREKNLEREYGEKLNSVHNEYKQEKLKADQLKKIVIDRDSKIEKLEEKVKDMRASQQEERPPSSWSTFQDRPPSRRSSVISNTLPSTELERMRLMELVTVLNKRLDEDRRTLENVQEQLRQEKHRSVRLETKCSRLELEKVGKGGGYGRRSASSTARSDTSRAELSAAKDRIALLEEKILALESRIERLRKEKEEDSRVYVRMVEEARQAMREHSRRSLASSNISLP